MKSQINTFEMGFLLMNLCLIAARNVNLSNRHRLCIILYHLFQNNAKLFILFSFSAQKKTIFTLLQALCSLTCENGMYWFS